MLKRKKLGISILVLMWVGLCLLLKLKSVFICLDVDEQYAVSLAYRIAKGDWLFFDMWEPHQLSAVFPALFVKLFMSVTGSTEYLLICLRVIGVLFQLVISLCWFLCFRKAYDTYGVFLSSVILFTVLPKWIQSPEFANQQIWWIAVSLMLFYKVITVEKNLVFTISLSLAMCFEVLAYPSTVITFFVVLFLLLAGNKKKEGIIFACSCCAVGLAVFLLLCGKHGIKGFFDSFVMVFSDSDHSESATDKVLRYSGDILNILKYLIAYFGIGFILHLPIKLIRKKRFSFESVCWIALIVATVDQYRLWFIEECPNVRPSVHFLIAFILFSWMVFKRKCGLFEKTVFACSISSFLSVILLSNLDMQASLVHLLPGVLGIGLLLGETEIKRIALSIYVFLISFSYFILVRFNQGWHADVFYVKQKALSGVAGNVYCEYLDGFSYNENIEFVKNNSSKGEKALYVGDNNLTYLFNDFEVCAASTMSTPVYDEKYIQYIDSHGENKKPDIVIVEKKYCTGNPERTSVLLDWVMEKYNQEGENENLSIWRRK